MTLTHSTAFHLGKITKRLPKCENGKRFMDCVSSQNNQYTFSFNPEDEKEATCTITIPNIVVVTGMSELKLRGLPIVGSRFSFNDQGHLISVAPKHQKEKAHHEH